MRARPAVMTCHDILDIMDMVKRYDTMTFHDTMPFHDLMTCVGMFKLGSAAGSFWSPIPSKAKSCDQKIQQY